MRALLIFALFSAALAAQNPTAKISNTTQPDSSDFHIGDRFEVIITGAPHQPVSVRTNRNGQLDWGPVAGWTDSGGRWSASGQFEKTDFGPWSEEWTVGGKLANPEIGFSVGPVCVAGGQAFLQQSGPNVLESCLTASGQQSFVTPSLGDSFRTPDGRLVTGQMQGDNPRDAYQMEVMQSLITGHGSDGPGVLAAKSGELIGRIIGDNALTPRETRNVLAMVRAAWEESPFRASPTAAPGMISLLTRLSSQSEDASLTKEIAETIAFVQSQ